jgi:caa(3)-type oxidase subunit IV
MTSAEKPDHGQSPSGLVLAGALLLALAGLSYGLSFVQLGRLGLPLALAIAACKALTVLFVFMGFGGLSTSAKLAAGAALLMVALLLGLMVADVATREPAPLPPPKASARADTTLSSPPNKITQPARNSQTSSTITAPRPPYSAFTVENRDT